MPKQLRLKTSDMVIYAIFGALLFTIAIMVCPILAKLSGLVATSCAGLDIIFEPLIASLAVLITRKRLGWPITLTIYGFLLVPTPILLGMPTVAKVIPYLVGGLVAMPFIKKFTKLWISLTAAVYILVSVLLTWGLYIVVGTPGGFELIKLGMISMPAMIIMGIAGALIGMLVYNKIKKKTWVRRLQK